MDGAGCGEGEGGGCPPGRPEPRPLKDDSPSPAGRGIRLLVLDIDGTLTDSRHEIRADTLAALERAKEAGIDLLLATGRRYRDVLAVADRLGVGGPIVTASGALVKRIDDHVTLSRATFAPGVLSAVLDIVDAGGFEPILYSDSFHDGFDFHCRRLPAPGGGTPGVAEYLARNAHLARVAADLLVDPPEGIFAGFTMGTRDAMLALERDVAAACPGHLSTHVIRSPRYRDWMCEIAPQGVTKWSGVRAIAATAGIPAAAICAVGDDVNDLPMIRAAGLGVAMGNAADEVKGAADLTVAANDDGGIADLVDRLLAGR